MLPESPEPLARFASLQSRLVDEVVAGGPSAMRRGTLVVLPSITFPTEELRKIIGIQYYEERMMYTLLSLRDPNLRLVYVTSIEVDPAIVDYYLSFLPQDVDALSRLTMIAVGDRAPSALTAKLLASDVTLERIRAAIDPGGGYILPFNVTRLEAMFAEQIGLPLLGPHPDLIPLGSKSGSRRIAKVAGVPVLPGSEDLYSVAEVEDAIDDVREDNPDAEAVVVKLNNGFSGQGNAIIDLRTVRFPLVETPTVFCAAEESWASFATKIEAEGAVVEELLRGAAIVSPSVQLSIAPDGSIETLSTHDQILGGPDDQVYLGCRFPARAEYRRAILNLALESAKVLAEEGVFGSFGIDFIGIPDREDPDMYLSEINLRVGGTTHPFQMAQLITDGTYDFSTGELSAGGRAKFYISTDNLKSDRYVGMTPADAVAAIERAGLGYDRATRTGTTLHLLGALKQYGKLGALCIANSYEAADELFENVVATLDVAGEVVGS
ncbi:MAG: peptide ligase PGM1-related protein [Actinomycetota bacterium]|nr:peptide ligase PGM1-related protein [Actinomycetota bacterium]